MFDRQTVMRCRRTNLCAAGRIPQSHGFARSLAILIPANRRAGICTNVISLNEIPGDSSTTDHHIELR